MIRALTVLGAALYLAALAYLTLSPVHLVADSAPSASLVPLRSIANQLASSTPPAHKAYEIIGNSLLLVPFGAILAIVLPRHRWGIVVAASAALAIGIELMQWALPIGRVVDIDDVLLNSLGSLLGYWLGSWTLTRSGLDVG